MWFYVRWIFALALGFAIGSTGLLAATKQATAPTIFTDHFPASRDFRRELSLLVAKGRLTEENQKNIETQVHVQSSKFRMPEALLWCLFFQESRLNHLAGISHPTGARGLGQFNVFGFDEVNNELDAYTPHNRLVMLDTFGKSILPIHARAPDAKNRSSYFSIPTAVYSSAAFLNNRYLQLERQLQKRGTAYNPDLLWLQAALAYNKGARSIYAFWNHVQRQNKIPLARTLTEPDAFFYTLDDAKFLRRSLERVWPDERSIDYAEEWMTHLKNLRSCSLSADGELGGAG